MLFDLFFHVVYKISNFNMWIAFGASFLYEKYKSNHFLSQAKLQRLQKIEDQIDMEKEDKTDANDDSDTFLKRLIESIIRNLEVTITDVHIRYEDKHSNQG